MVRACVLTLALVFSSALPAAGGGDDDKPPSTYLELKPDFVVNIGDRDSGRSYVKAAITLRFHDGEIREKAEAHEPWLRHELVMLLSDQPVERMQSSDGQKELREEARERLNERLKMEMPDAVRKMAEKEEEGDDDEDKESGDGEPDNGNEELIREVLFPDFIVQVR